MKRLQFTTGHGPDNSPSREAGGSAFQGRGGHNAEQKLRLSLASGATLSSLTLNSPGGRMT